MQNDLISRSALMKYLRDYKWEFAMGSDFSKAMEMIDAQPTAYDVEKEEKERKALQKRCKVFTNGVICGNCPMVCDERTMPFFGKKVE